MSGGAVELPSELRGLPEGAFLRVYYKTSEGQKAAVGLYRGVRGGAVVVEPEGGGELQRAPLRDVTDVSVPSRPEPETWRAGSGGLLWPIYALGGALFFAFLALIGLAMVWSDDVDVGNTGLGFGLGFGVMAGSFLAGGLDGRRRSLLVTGAVMSIVGPVLFPFALLAFLLVVHALGASP